MWATALIVGQILALGRAVLVSRSLSSLPQIRYGIDAGSFLKHSLDRIQENWPLALALALASVL